MKERGILFSAPMVCALLDGSKSQTRRILKSQPNSDSNITVGTYHPTVVDRHGDEQPGPERFGAFSHDGEWGQPCPYGQPGDRLWVRETWAGPMYDADLPFQPTDLKSPKYCVYAADGGQRPEFLDADDNLCQRWTPAIHMFRWASRITLEITYVRVERLQDISNEDARLEGVMLYQRDRAGPDAEDSAVDYRQGYRWLWESINGAGSWEKNPWVWVVEFRVLR